MKTLDQILAEVKEELDKEPIVQTYFSLKEQIESNEELNKLKDQIAKAQVELSVNFGSNDKVYLKKKESLLVLKKRFNEHPLVINYHFVCEEVNELLIAIKNILE